MTPFVHLKLVFLIANVSLISGVLTSLAELQRGDLFEAHGRVFTLRQVFATVVELQTRERRLFWIAGVAL